MGAARRRKLLGIENTHDRVAWRHNERKLTAKTAEKYEQVTKGRYSVPKAMEPLFARAMADYQVAKLEGFDGSFEDFLRAKAEKAK